jgi:hypothetical protein
MRWLLLQRFIHLQTETADANQLMRPALYAAIASGRIQQGKQQRCLA